MIGDIVGKIVIFFPSASAIALIFVGGNTLHSCYVLHVEFN